MSTLQTTILKHPDSGTNNIQFDSSGNSTFASQAKALNFRVNTTGGVQAGALASGEWFTTSAGADADIVFGAAGNNFYFHNASTSTDLVKIDSSGNVGINNTSPVATLDVSGTQVSNVVAVAALDVDCSLGNYFTKTINGNSTFTFSNVPASRAFSFVLELTHTSGTVTWPSSVKFPADTAPTLTTGKTHLFVFISDSGSTRFRAATVVDYVN